MRDAARLHLTLVGIDYSTASALALEHALTLSAARPNSVVHVVHVASNTDPPLATFSPFSGALDAEASLATDHARIHRVQQLMTYVAVSLGEFYKKFSDGRENPVPVVSHLRDGDHAHQVTQLASELGADLVVVGMHGRGRLARFFLGSVAQEVARFAPCPVLVFRPKLTVSEHAEVDFDRALSPLEGHTSVDVADLG